MLDLVLFVLVFKKPNNLFAKNNKYVLENIQNYPLIMEVQEKSWSDSLRINLQGIGKQFALNAPVP